MGKLKEEEEGNPFKGRTEVDKALYSGCEVIVSPNSCKNFQYLDVPIVNTQNR